MSEARIKRDEARAQLDQGVDPSEHRKVMKAVKADRKTNSFEIIAREWYLKNVTTWAPTHSETVIRRLERDIFPSLGNKAMSEVTAPLLLLCAAR